MDFRPVKSGDHPLGLGVKCVKPHDDGIEHGIVARVWNVAPEDGLVRLAVSAPTASVQRVTHIETPLSSLPMANGVLETTISARSIESYNLIPPR